MSAKAIVSKTRTKKKKKDPTEFVYIVFRQHLCRINLSRLSRRPQKPPPLETLISFPEKNYPVGMGANCLRSNLYLFGGEKLLDGKRIEDVMPLALERDFERMSRTVFLFNPSEPHHLYASSVPPMNAAKPGAKSVMVDGKLFVLTGLRYCFRGKPPDPRFECYDPAVNRWDPLPDPPFRWRAEIVNVSVVGRRIILSHGAHYKLGIDYYDLDEEVWRNGDEEYLGLKPCPFEFDGCMAEYDGIIIGFNTEGVVAYRDNSLKHPPQRILPQLLNSDKYFPKPYPCYQNVHFRSLGDGRFCIVMTQSLGAKFNWDAHVALFRVKKLENPTEEDNNFVEAVLLAYHLYDGYETALRFDYSRPTEVFTMVNQNGISSD